MIDRARASGHKHACRAPASLTVSLLVLLSACSAANEERPSRVATVSHWGHYEEAKDIEEVAALLHQDFIRFNLGPYEPRATFDLDGHTINLEFVEAYEEIPPGVDIEQKFYARTVDLCQDETSYLKLRVNGFEAILLREQLKEVTLKSGYSFLVSAPDVEDMRESRPSDLVLIRFK